MKRKIVIISTFLACFFAISGAQSNPLEAPDETYEIQMDSGWNTLSIPASNYGYYVSLDNLKDDSSNECQFSSGNQAYTLEKEPESMSRISAQRGYVVYVENDEGCELSFDPKNLKHELSDQDAESEKVNTLDGWKVVSVPEEMSLSDYKDTIIPACELTAQTYEIDSDSFENKPLQDSDTMNPDDIYWIKTAENCIMEMSNYAGATPQNNDNEDSSTSDDNEEEDSDSSNKFNWDVDGVKPSETVGKNEEKTYSFQIQDDQDKLSGAEISLKGKAKNLGDWAWHEHNSKTCSEENSGSCGIAADVDLDAAGGEYIFQASVETEGGRKFSEEWTYRETEKPLENNWDIVKNPNDKETTGLDVAKSDGMPKRIDTGNSGYCGTVYLEKPIVENSFTLGLDLEVDAGEASESIFLSRVRDGNSEIIHELNPSGGSTVNLRWNVDVKEGDSVRVVISDIVGDCPEDAYVDMKVQDLRTVN